MTPGAIAGLAVGMVIIGLIIGFFIGYFILKKVMEKQMKKNPPITKDTIRMMYAQIGRKPTEQQVNELFNKTNKTNKK